MKNFLKILLKKIPNVQISLGRTCNATSRRTSCGISRQISEELLDQFAKQLLEARTDTFGETLAHLFNVQLFTSLPYSSRDGKRVFWRNNADGPPQTVSRLLDHQGAPMSMHNNQTGQAKLSISHVL